MNPTISLDFDGVLHSYTSGWQGIDSIPDPPVDGAFDFLCTLVRETSFDVAIYSSRSRERAGREAMKAWFQDRGLPEDVFEALSFPSDKPPAKVSLDDRAIHFDGEFPDIETLQTFEPWNKG